MATVYGNEVTKQRAGRNLNPDEWGGKIRIVRWSFTTPAAGNNIGDVWVLGRLRKGDRVLAGGQSIHAAAGAGTFNIGTYGIAAGGDLGAVVDADAVASALAGATATVEALPEAGNAADAGGYVAANDEYLCITNIGTAFGASVAFQGYLLVVGD